MENKNREIFNKIAKEYINPWINDKKEKKRIERIISRFGLKKDMIVLEPGCGRGDFTPFILKKIGSGGFIYSVDVSDEMLKYARKNLKKYKNVKIINSCASKLPLKSGEIDAVVVFNSFPHFYPKKNFIKEFYRILKNNGFLIIAHDLPGQKVNKIHKNANFNMNKNLLPVKKEMFKILKKQGFIIKKYINREYYLLKAVKK